MIDDLYSTINKFGVILYRNTPYLPLTAIKVDEEGGVELYDIIAQDMTVGHHWRSKFPSMYKAVPSYLNITSLIEPDKYAQHIYEVPTKKEEDSVKLYTGFIPQKLHVAFYRRKDVPHVIEQRWPGGSFEYSPIVYAGRTHGIAHGSVKKAKKRLMMKKMGV